MPVFSTVKFLNHSIGSPGVIVAEPNLKMSKSPSPSTSAMLGKSLDGTPMAMVNWLVLNNILSIINLNFNPKESVEIFW